jgi:hypothetical protein
MSSTSEPTLEQALTLARRLSPQDRAALIGRLALELATPSASTSLADSDAWERWAALRDEIGSVYPDAQLGERLAADRRERDASLRGMNESDDVHA